MNSSLFTFFNFSPTIMYQFNLSSMAHSYKQSESSILYHVVQMDQSEAHMSFKRDDLIF